jgi:hypothetical protein
MRITVLNFRFRLLLWCSALLFAVGLHAAEPRYSPDVAGWLEIPVPPNGKNSDRAVWHFATNYSQISWRVYLDARKPKAKLIDSPNDDFSDPAPFDARADKFQGANRFRMVDDGWLVGFNHGEFGAALYWFDRSGKQHYKISNDQVVSFFSLPDGIYAIEGLAHMGASCGSVVRIARPAPGAHWAAQRVVHLPYAPTTVAVRRDGSMLIALTDSLVSVSPDYQIKTLIPDVPWDSLYPSSAMLNPDERRLYLGMRQFVGEVDLNTNQLRLLVPNKDFLNKLPADQEKTIREQTPEGTTSWKPPADLCEQLEKARLRNDR